MPPETMGERVLVDSFKSINNLRATRRRGLESLQTELKKGVVRPESLVLYSQLSELIVGLGEVIFTSTLLLHIDLVQANNNLVPNDMLTSSPLTTEPIHVKIDPPPDYSGGFGR